MGGLDIRPAMPALIVTLTAIFVLLDQAFTRKGTRASGAVLSVVGLACALGSVYLLATQRLFGAAGARGVSMGESLVFDEFAIFFHFLILGIGLLTVLLSPSYFEATGQDRGEYYALLLFSLVGMLGLASSRELISLFVALEIMSVALYGLAGLHRERPESQESAMKYFVTGAFSSAFFLYGIALLYGVAGSTYLPRILSVLAAAKGGTGSLAIVGVGLLLVGFGFKVASVPFHMWTPDVYEGAPTTVTVLMAAGVKAAAFAALLRVFAHALPESLASHWRPAVTVLALLTMVVGNLAALVQTNLKRMLAYSSVAHAGYLLVALVALPRTAIEAVLFYLVAYGVVNVGAFGSLAALARGVREPGSLSDLAGLAQRRPALAAALTVFLVSLTGVPVSAGFVGKFYLFSAAVGAEQAGLAIVGVLMSVVSAYYYLRVVVAMYMRDAAGEDAWAQVSPAATCALAASAAVVLGLGVYPGPLLAWARLAASTIQ